MTGSDGIRRLIRRVRYELFGSGGETSVIRRLLVRKNIAVVLGEYGSFAVKFLDACMQAGIPLVPHFHGADASHHEIVKNNESGYRRLFQHCPAIIVVSRRMLEDLVNMGAPREKIHHICYGVNLNQFSEISPGSNPPNFVSVGRFVEKKAPHLTILAFKQVHKKLSSSKLVMVGDGPLLDSCRSLVAALGLGDAVSFSGKAKHQNVARYMNCARAYVQHSIEAPNGDSEGTPVAILEACASALPVVATQHAGIPDIITHGETGFLVTEHDVDGMAAHMLRLATNPDLANSIGLRAARRVHAGYEMSQSIEKLSHVLHCCRNELSVCRKGQ